MVLTPYQQNICRLIAANRIASGASYIAGGVALNTLLEGTRISRDIDIFHDTEQAVTQSWDNDRSVLEEKGYSFEVLRERSVYVEAVVRKDGQSVRMEWARDSAFRFFPLIENDILGLTLHPFDLATNKALALAGRLEVRDWIDIITCHDKLQPLGYLLWAACGKDPGFSPGSLLNESRRGSRYSEAEVDGLVYDAGKPDAADLSRHWHIMLKEAEELIDLLPAEQTGMCVLDKAGDLFRGDPKALHKAVKKDKLCFHAGTLNGALPQIIEGP
ncbi:hypothetical protein ACFL4W_02190 [Planctomycetota bacterium]